MSRLQFAAFLALAIGAGAVPAQAADLCLAFKFKCDGFEPNWQLTTGTGEEGGTVVTFTDPENPNWETDRLIVPSCLLQGSPNDFELTADAPLSLIANIVGQDCVKPNEEHTDFSVTVTYKQGALSSHPAQVEGTGCCQKLE
jgi:hypothetical protein